MFCKTIKYSREKRRSASRSEITIKVDFLGNSLLKKKKFTVAELAQLLLFF